MMATSGSFSKDESPRIDIAQLSRDSYLADAEHYASLPSTQERAREAAANPLARLPLLVLADDQTAGRGRGGNSWWTGAGSLAFSLLLDPADFGCPRQAIPCFSLAVSVSIIDAIAPRTTGRQIGLHWPNDVFVEGRKLAGVLVEVLPDGRHIIGVGLNLNNQASFAPLELQSRLTTLRDLTGQAHPPTEVLIELLAALGDNLTRLGADPESLGERFNELCLQRGSTVTVYLGETAVTGICLGIAPDGGLLLETSAGPRSFYSGTLQPPRSHG